MSLTFTFTPMPIPEIILIEARTFGDHRGYFREVFKASVFGDSGLPSVFPQINTSHSTLGVLRGLHYQKHPRAQGKLVSVLHGEIFDVAVDLRAGSPHYGRWVGAHLSAANGRMLYVPPGFAHGFCALSEEADVLYQVTTEWAPHLEAGVVWNDPQLGIAWPVEQPVISDKDARLPFLRDADINFVYDRDR